MCTRTKCRKCGMPTWRGCGQHIEQALAGVAKSQRCPGHAKDPKESNLFTRLFKFKK